MPTLAVSGGTLTGAGTVTPTDFFAALEGETIAAITLQGMDLGTADVVIDATGNPNTGTQFALESIADLATSHILTLTSSKRRSIDQELHRHGGFVDAKHG